MFFFHLENQKYKNISVLPEENEFDIFKYFNINKSIFISLIMVCLLFIKTILTKVKQNLIKFFTII